MEMQINEQNNNVIVMSSIYLFVIIFMVILLSGLIIPQLVNAHSEHAHIFDGILPVHEKPLIPPNQGSITDLTRAQIAEGLNLPKNLIVASCVGPPNGGGSGTACPPIVGTTGDDLIIATAVADASIFGIGGNDVIQCGPGNCKVYAGPGDNVMMASGSSTAQLYGGFGNNMFIGGSGDTVMVGGKGNDQFYAGINHDILIGGGGRNYFDCGTSGNGVILDFNAKTDTKAGNCKYVLTVKTGVPVLP